MKFKSKSPWNQRSERSIPTPQPSEFAFINCCLVILCYLINYVTFSQDLDKTWQGMRWILDALHYARDRQIRGGIPLVEVFEYTVSHPDGQCCVCSSDLKGKIICNGHSKDTTTLTYIHKYCNHWIESKIERETLHITGQVMSRLVWVRFLTWLAQKEKTSSLSLIETSGGGLPK